MLLTFAQSVERVTTTLARRLEDERCEAEALRKRLRTLRTGGYAIPALVVVELVLERSDGMLQRLKAVRTSIRQTLRQLGEALPGVTVANPSKMMATPKRTKVFQEVRPYADVFMSLLNWQSVENVSVGREGLGLHALRATKLYEYYALHELLGCLQRNGYTQNKAYSEPFHQAHYSLGYRKFANEHRVANTYHLALGNTRVDLYYQPVIYGTELEENGIDLHRTTSTSPFESHGRTDAPYTPDFLIYLRDADGNVMRRIALDTKFVYYRRLYAEGCPMEFMECARKYLLETATSDGGRIDAVWLLSAVGDYDKCLPFEASAWASRRHATRSGIVCVNPTASALKELFRECGIPLDSPDAAMAETRTVDGDGDRLANGALEATIAPSESQVEEATEHVDREPTTPAQPRQGLSVPMSHIANVLESKALVNAKANPTGVPTSLSHVHAVKVDPAEDAEVTSTQDQEVNDAAERATAVVQDPSKEGKQKTKKPKKPKPQKKKRGAIGMQHDQCATLISGLIESNDFFAQRVNRELERDGCAVKLREGVHLLRTASQIRGKEKQYAQVSTSIGDLYILRERNPALLAQVRSILKKSYGVST